VTQVIDTPLTYVHVGTYVPVAPSGPYVTVRALLANPVPVIVMDVPPSVVSAAKETPAAGVRVVTIGVA
jgi:hypothetical protein